MPWSMLMEVAPVTLQVSAKLWPALTMAGSEAKLAMTGAAGTGVGVGGGVIVVSSSLSSQRKLGSTWIPDEYSGMTASKLENNNGLHGRYFYLGHLLAVPF